MHRSLIAIGSVLAVLAGCSPAPGVQLAPPAPPPSIAPGIVTSVPTSAPPQTAIPAASIADAADFPDSSRYTWTPVASGFESPVDIQFAPDGSDRMFIVEQPGRIRAFAPDAPATSPFLDITDRIESTGNEQGLLGLAFHPQFASNGLFFVNYTDRAHHNVIARFLVQSGARQADPASESFLISTDDPFPNHNGGVLAFGADGLLYAGLGDGGGANDPLGNGQNTQSLLGKILRLDVDGAEPYAIRFANPFVSGGGRPEIWAYGLRNPWRFSFDMLTGDLYIGDVGQGTWEEVDFLPAGSSGGMNFGWNYREGMHPFSGNPPAGAQLVDPVAEYSHAEGGCSITGGYVYRGSLSEWNGIYFFADYCSGKIWGMLPVKDAGSSTPRPVRLLFETRAHITTFGQDHQGEVYFADRGGTIFRLQAK